MWCLSNTDSCVHPVNPTNHLKKKLKNVIFILEMVEKSTPEHYQRIGQTRLWEMSTLAQSNLNQSINNVEHSCSHPGWQPGRESTLNSTEHIRFIELDLHHQSFSTNIPQATKVKLNWKYIWIIKTNKSTSLWACQTLKSGLFPRHCV